MSVVPLMCVHVHPFTPLNPGPGAFCTSSSAIGVGFSSIPGSEGGSFYRMDVTAYAYPGSPPGGSWLNLPPAPQVLEHKTHSTCNAVDNGRSLRGCACLTGHTLSAVSHGPMPLSDAIIQRQVLVRLCTQHMTATVCCPCAAAALGASDACRVLLQHSLSLTGRRACTLTMRLPCMFPCCRLRRLSSTRT